MKLEKQAEPNCKPSLKKCTGHRADNTIQAALYVYRKPDYTLGLATCGPTMIQRDSITVLKAHNNRERPRGP